MQATIARNKTLQKRDPYQPSPNSRWSYEVASSLEKSYWSRKYALNGPGRSRCVIIIPADYRGVFIFCTDQKLIREDVELVQVVRVRDKGPREDIQVVTKFYFQNRSGHAIPILSPSKDIFEKFFKRAIQAKDGLPQEVQRHFNGAWDIW